MERVEPHKAKWDSIRKVLEELERTRHCHSHNIHTHSDKYTVRHNTHTFRHKIHTFRYTTLRTIHISDTIHTQIHSYLTHMHSHSYTYIH